MIEQDEKYYQEVDMTVYREELKNFLPEKIFDFHVHIWKEHHLVKGFSPVRMKMMPSLGISNYAVEDAKKSMEKLYPGKDCGMLVFGNPVREISIDMMNDYINSVVDEEKVFGLLIPTIGDSATEIEEKFFKGRFLGLKPYPDFVTSKNSRDADILDFATKEQFEVANEYGLIIVLHISKEGRLEDRQNISDIQTCCEKYSNVKLVLAHAGRSYCIDNIEKPIDEIKDIPNLYYDLTMINSAQVIEVLLARVSPKKIIYGTDLPLAELRGRNVCINKNHYFVTKNKYPWAISSTQEIEIKATFFAYECIRAVKRAVGRLGLGNETVKDIFYNNAISLITSVIENITDRREKC